MESEAERLMEELSRDLGLCNEQQDWGIINADPTRVRHFLDYFDSQPLTSTQRFEMGELIIASVNEAILECQGSRITISRETEENSQEEVVVPTGAKPFALEGILARLLLE